MLQTVGRAGHVLGQRQEVSVTFWHFQVEGLPITVCYFSRDGVFGKDRGNETREHRPGSAGDKGPINVEAKPRAKRRVSVWDWSNEGPAGPGEREANNGASL